MTLAAKHNDSMVGECSHPIAGSNGNTYYSSQLY